MDTVHVLLNATGESRALHPLTETITSPMLPVVDRPVMAYMIEALVRQGFKQMQVCLHHLGGSVEAYIGDGRRWGAQIDYVLQKEAWGTAGSVKWACQSQQNTVVVIPADILIDVDLQDALAHHRQSGSVATIVTHDQARGSARPVQLNKHIDPNTPPSYETGIYIFEPSVLTHIPTRQPFDCHQALIPALLAAGENVSVYKATGYWCPLKTFEQYHQAQRETLYSATTEHTALNGFEPLRFPSIEGNQIAPGIWVGPNHVIHPTAQLRAPVYIGRNCQIGQNVELGPAAIVGSHVVVDESATVQNSAILHRTYVGRLVNVESKVVHKNLMVDPTSAEHTKVVDTFLLSETSPQTIGVSLQEIIGRMLALLLLVVSAPIWLSTGLLLLLTSGRLFEKGTYLAGSDKSNLINLTQFHTQSWIGRWLKSWDFNRWPLLWSVVTGRLALVGVGLLDPDQADEITEVWQQQRFDYPAGFTGLWYTATQPTSTLDEILVSDTYYVATRTGREDMRILWQTPRAWWRRAKTKGKIREK